MILIEYTLLSIAMYFIFSAEMLPRKEKKSISTSTDLSPKQQVSFAVFCNSVFKFQDVFKEMDVKLHLEHEVEEFET